MLGYKKHSSKTTLTYRNNTKQENGKEGWVGGWMEDSGEYQIIAKYTKIFHYITIAPILLFNSLVGGMRR